MGDQTIVEKFLTELEHLFSKQEEQLEDLNEKETNYQIVQDLLAVLTVSKIAFLEGIVAMPEKEKQSLKELLTNIFCDERFVNQVFAEIQNLYYLKEANLLEEPIVAPQREQAEETIQTLLNSLLDYTKKYNPTEIARGKEEAESFIEKLVQTGDAFTDGKLDRPMEDIDFLERILVDVDLTEEEKFQLLKKVWLENVAIYQELLSPKKTIQIEIEGASEEVREETDDRIQKRERVITQEEEEQIMELLRDGDTLQKLIHILDVESLKLVDYTQMDKKDLEGIIDLAKDEIMTILYEEKLSPKEALNRFFEQNDQREDQAKEILDKILDTTPHEILMREEQKEISQRAEQFVQSEKNDFEKLSYSERKILDNYISGLYRNKAARITMYKSKTPNLDKSQIRLEAAYEMNYFLNLLRSLDIDTEEDYLLASRICIRLQEIEESYQEVTKNTKKDFIPEVEKDPEIFFLPKNPAKTFFEEDIQLDSDNKGISKTYYGGIEDSLEQLESTGPEKMNVTRGTWKNLKNLGVKYKEGNRTGIFYVPTGEKDMIVIGVGFINGREDNFKEADDRVRLNEAKIQQMKEDLTHKEERLIYQRQASAIRKQLKHAYKKKEELDRMLSKEPEEFTYQAGQK